MVKITILQLLLCILYMAVISAANNKEGKQGKLHVNIVHNDLTDIVNIIYFYPHA